MEATILVFVLITLFVRWLVLSGRMNAIQQRIEQVAADQAQPLLTRRVYDLELAVKELRAMRPADAPAGRRLPGGGAGARAEPVPELRSGAR